ncbi:hypothetical protein NDU88_000935 [Pleurodeles waltl]|uniref:Uncharacterized protein n=1 Tax=Pleurodeles waltl TaxID=8319 RepID=A0AAV7P789_PLEWA|nr:hypothetical protein NDU88_000935 [Pleurodeles waltl]
MSENADSLNGTSPSGVICLDECKYIRILDIFADDTCVRVNRGYLNADFSLAASLDDRERPCRRTEAIPASKRLVDCSSDIGED